MAKDADSAQYGSMLVGAMVSGRAMLMFGAMRGIIFMSVFTMGALCVRNRLDCTLMVNSGVTQLS